MYKAESSIDRFFRLGLPMAGGDGETDTSKANKEDAENKGDGGISIDDPSQVKGSTPSISADSLAKMVHDLAAMVKKNGEEREKNAKMMEDITKMQNQLKASGKVQSPQFKTSDALDMKGVVEQAKMDGMDVNKLVLFETKDPHLAYIQEQSDMIYIASEICHAAGGSRKDVTGWNLYKKFMHELGAFNKALAGAIATGGGTEWIPTNFSSSLVELVRLELKVAALHERISMPTPTFTLPVEGSDMFAYLVGESVSDAGTSIPTSTPQTKNVSFVAKKIATRVLTSAELTEDSVVSILPYLRQRIVRALAFAEEYAILNGDTTGTRDNTDQAGNTIGANSNIKAWDGYREILADIGQGVAIDAAGAFLTDGTHLLRIRASMGKYGINPSDLVWVTGPRGFNKMLQLTNIRTLDKFGTNAVLFTGQLGSIFGMPVIVSEWMREDLNGSGVSGGASSGNTDTTIVAVNRRAFAIGDRRMLTLKSEEVIDTDQIKLVATQRLDFKGLYPTSETTIGSVYDLE